jgi:transcriptional regulator with XRE-family HTH domain
MHAAALLAQARREAHLSQDELARLGRTSRPTLSAYEHGRKSPTLDTAERLLAQTGHTLTAVPRVEFVPVPLTRGRLAQVPTSLPRLPLSQAMARVELPLRLNWSQQGRTFSLANRSERARVYEAVLTEGLPEDVLQYIDGALLVDSWEDLVLPRPVRAAWQPLISAAAPGAACCPRRGTRSKPPRTPAAGP